MALTYYLRVGTTPGGSQIVAPQSSPGGYRRLPTFGNAQHRLTAHLRSLVSGTTYYWSVQSVDAGLAGSAFAPEASFAVSPALRIEQVTTNATNLVWPAPSPGFVLQQNPSLGTTNWKLRRSVNFGSNGPRVRANEAQAP